MRNDYAHEVEIYLEMRAVLCYSSRKARNSDSVLQSIRRIYRSIKGVSAFLDVANAVSSRAFVNINKKTQRFRCWCTPPEYSYFVL